MAGSSNSPTKLIHLLSVFFVRETFAGSGAFRSHTIHLHKGGLYQHAYTSSLWLLCWLSAAIIHWHFLKILNTAGYVVRHLRHHLGRGSHQLKEGLVLCLEEMCGDTGKDCSASTNWTGHVNKGGLKVVDSKPYHFLLLVETRLRRFLCVTEAPNISGGSKGILVEHTSCGEDVLFT